MPRAARLSPGAAWRLTLAALAVALGIIAGKSPQLALGVAAALVFVGLVWGNYTVAIGVFIVTTFLPLPGTVAKGAGMVLVLAWFAMIATRSSRDFPDFASAHKAITLLLLAFVTWTLMSLTWAESTAAVFTSLGRYIPNFVLFFLIYAAADKRSHALVLLGFFVLGGAVAAADGVASPPSATLAADVSRTGGTFGDPNYLAAVLVLTLALGGALASVRSLLPALRVGAMIACALSVAGILLTVSRGGLIALGVALVVSVFIAGKWRAKLAAITVLITLVTVGYFAFYASPAVRQRVTESNGGSGRADIWTVGWRMVEAHPLNGVGAGNFQIADRHYLLRPGATTHAAYILNAPKAAHNAYLEVLAEGGIPALAMFLAIVGFSLRCTAKAWRAFRRSRDRELELVCYALFAGLVGFLAASFFLSQEYSKQLWLLLAFGPFLLRISSLSVGAATPSPRPAAVV
jgi:O-antigen ligase